MARTSPQTPHDALKAAVKAAYPVTTRFFEAVGEAAHVTPESARGTFYGFLRKTESNRSLPPQQREAYLRLLPIESVLLDEIDATRPKAIPAHRREDRLESLAEWVAEILEGQKEVMAELRGIRASLDASTQPRQAAARRSRT